MKPQLVEIPKPKKKIRQRKKKEEVVEVREETTLYAYLEDPSHGICIESIKIPSWHPQRYFDEERLSEYMASLQEGYAMSVNVYGDAVELIDDVGFLMAAKEMKLKHPPLDISRCQFPDVCMLSCYNTIELSEWEAYLLFESILKHTKLKTLGKWVDMAEKELQVFMQRGKEITEKGDEIFFMQLVRENISLFQM